jgi:quercetin dioxygenase-like cupin family protein
MVLIDRFRTTDGYRQGDRFVIELKTSFQLDDFGCWQERQDQPVAVIQPEETHAETQAKVDRLAAAMRQMQQADIPVTHRFLDGIYVREVFMPRGAIVVGKIHKQEHIAIISKGRATVLTEDGLKEIKAPYTFKSPPGVRRALVIHEDMIWTTVHRSDETDLDKLEDQLIAKDFAELTHAEVELLCHG